MNSDCARDNGSISELPTDQASRVIRILEGYLGDLERGRPPYPDELMAQHPELADVLRNYLEKLNVLHCAATGLRGPLNPDRPGPSAGEESMPPCFLPERGRLGDFHILREVGRGGMGIVYEAEQISLGRRVALKVLPFAAALDAKQLQRFKSEAQAAAHLHHSNIVPVHFVGSDRSVHYYAMQFIEGQTLAAMIAELRHLAGLMTPDTEPSTIARPPGSNIGAVMAGIETKTERTATQISKRPTRNPGFFRTVAEIGVQAAEALEHAHEMGVIHRDIKPANLMVDAQVHIWVTDFGLAMFQGEGGLTLTGDLVGTLRYMSPEQALGKRCLVDHRTDIYSLGITLYELLTLEPAYGGADRQELLQQIAFEDPRPPRKLNPAVPVELETILLKAMAKEPNSRYTSARALADDLRRFLENKPILARRPTLQERARKWASRHKSVVMMGIVLMVLAAAGFATSTVLIYQQQAKTQEALGKAQEQWLLVRAKEAETRQQFKRADSNFRKACNGVTELLLLLERKEWKRLPRMSELRGELADQSLKFFHSFVDEESSDPAIRVESGRAYRVKAGVYNIQGKPCDAIKASRKAISLFEQLTHDYPENCNYLYELGLGHYLLGLMLDDNDKEKEALIEFRDGERFFREALARDPYHGATLNDLAWFLCTCPQKSFRKPDEAVVLAQRALGSCPECGATWNTLGVACYRVGNYRGAIEALEKSMKFRDGGDSGDWFFLAMAYHQIGKHQQAEEWYKKGMREIQQANFTFEPLSRYRDEAQVLMHPDEVVPRERIPCKDK